MKLKTVFLAQLLVVVIVVCGYGQAGIPDVKRIEAGIPEIDNPVTVQIKTQKFYA